MKNIQLFGFMVILIFLFDSCAQTKPTVSYNSKDGKSGFNHQNFQAGTDIDEVKATISGILNKIEISDKKNQLRGWPTDILVLDNRIKCKIKNQDLVINFADLSNYSAEAIKIKGSKCILEDEKIDFIVTNWTPGNSQMLEQLRQNLIYMKNQSNQNSYESNLILFKPIAAKYRELKVKPQVSEEQRKYIVQANAFNEQKNFVKAIELYGKAIEVDQTAYPAGYSNLALLSAQINNFDAAIYYMKKYLLLEPDGSDARSTQDKIYEWEAVKQ